MKGPGGRLKFDIRRVWECPVCHRRELADGHVVNVLCPCGSKADPPRQIWMKLIETRPARPAAIASPPAATGQAALPGEVGDSDPAPPNAAPEAPPA